MARSRNIKPSLFKNELLGVIDPLITILFESLWCLADREGRLEDRPLRIKAETFPYRENLDVNGYLTELARLDFIERYVVDGVGYIQVVNFKKHQTPHKTERQSSIPTRSKNIEQKQYSCLSTVKAPLSNDGLTAALPPDLLIPDSLNLIPDSKTTPFVVSEKIAPESSTAKPVDGVAVSVVSVADSGREQSESDNGIPDCPQQEIIALYKQHLPMLTAPRIWQGARAQALKARWRYCAAPNGIGRGYHNKADGLKFWDKFFAHVAASKVLTHGITGRDGRTWMPDLPWLLKAENFAKVMEGNYD